MAKVVYDSSDLINKGEFTATMKEIEAALKSLDSSFSDFSKRLDKHLSSNTEVINKAKKSIQDWQKTVDGTKNNAKNFTDVIQDATNAIYEQHKATAEAVKSTKASKKEQEALAGSLDALKQKYKEVVTEGSKIDATTEEFKKLQTEAQKLDTEIKSLNKGFKEQAEVIQKTTTEQKSAANSIDELKKKYKELVEQANKLDSTTQEFKDLQNQAAKLDTEISTLNKGFKEQKEILDTTVKAQQAVAGSLDDLKAKYKKVIDEANKIDANTQAFKNLQDEAQKLEKEIKGLSVGFKAQKDIAQDAAGSYDQLSKKNAALKRELKSMPNVFGANAEAAKRMQKEIAANDKKLKEFDTTIGESFRNVGNYASAFDGLTGGLASLVAGGGIAAGISLGIEKVGELINAFLEINEQISKTSQLTDLTGQSLQDATASARAISQVFKQDFEQTLLTQNSLVKTFGLSFKEVGNIMSIAFATGGNASGDLLDQLQEYDVFFKQAGFSAQEFASILTSATKQGVFSDKAADLVKEFGLRINEQTKSTSDALTNAFGKDFTTKLFKGVNDGSITTKQALLTVTEQINKTGIAGAKLGAITADVFGGPGEDVGQDFLKSLPETIRFAEKMAGTTQELSVYLKEYGNTLNENQKSIIKNKIAEDEYIESQIKLAARFSGVSSDLSIAFTKAKTIILNFINELFDDFKTIGVSIEKFFSLFGEGTTDKILDFFGTLLSFPFTNYATYVDTVADGFKRLVATIFGVSNAIKIFKIEFADSFQAIKDFANGEISFDTLKKNIKSQGEGVANAFKVGYEKTLAELNLASAAPVDSGDAGTPTNKAKNDKANESLAVTAEKYKTIAELKKELVKLESDLDKELAKTAAKQRPEFLEKTRSEIEKINKLLAERKLINANLPINDLSANVNLDTSAKDKLVELGALAEEYRQKREKGLITQQDLELALFDVEKQRIEYQLANAAALNLNEEQIAKLKTEQITLNQELAKNPVAESLRIIAGQETILREQRAKGLFGDIELNTKLLDLEEKKVQFQLANAEKLKLSQEEINQLKLTQAEIDKQQAAQAFNTPINNAAQEALLSYVDNAIAAAGITAFLNALKNGEKVNIAFQQAGQAAASAAILSVFSKTKRAKGEIDIKGPGTGTSDSIPALISNGESVITADGTDKAPIALDLINKGKLRDEQILPNINKRNLTNTANLPNLQRENQRIIAYESKLQTQNNNEQKIINAIEQGVNRAVREKITVTNVSVETIKGSVAVIAEKQGNKEITVYENPSKPKKFGM